MRPRRGSRHRPPLSARARALAGARVTRCSPRAALSPCGRARAPRLARWIGFVVVLWIYLIRVYYINGWYIVTYGVGIYLLNNFIGFLSPQARARARAPRGGATRET